jgi:hypothetical protein
MDEFVSALITTLPEGNCGCTVDWHRGDDNGRVVQWLWAKPADTAEDLSHVSELVTRLESVTRFVPGDASPFTTHLPNVVALLQSCPFQQPTCAGTHVVASGSGRLQ